jgi:glycosyltransferase involved in cell wall biosynthesis
MTPVSVFTPSYNKGEYVLEGIRSILAQTRPDLELWLLENSTDGVTREIIKDSGLLADERIVYEEIDELPRGYVNIMGWLLNKYYVRAEPDSYIFYMSDDDVLPERSFEHLAGHLDENPDHEVCWGTLFTICAPVPGILSGADAAFTNAIPARYIASPGTVDCRIDGGQIMHRKRALDAIEPPYFEESPVLDIARHIDGIFMERLVAHFPFYPVPKHVVTHRMTPSSTYSPL